MIIGTVDDDDDGLKSKDSVIVFLEEFINKNKDKNKISEINTIHIFSESQ